MSGHYLNSILLTFHNQGSVNKGAFLTNAQSRFASVAFDGVLGTQHLARHTCLYPYFSVVTKVINKARRGPLNGAMSALKALQGSETETRELLGWKRIVFPQHWVIDLSTMIFFSKRN